ncbi:MAG: carotenoid oxygenase family protein [bacterium]|nr:lignostilbene alpha-beta-dioxygenase [Gammaproteobacteria bacterium]HIL97872.1 lignostilbene alpha-beta-dioxygenase [Pseudomonadales bacterium]
MSLQVEGANEIPSCQGGLENLDEEHDYWLTDNEGDVPKDIRGTFFRNGPGRQKIGGKPYGHWFDGDGMLCAFSFVDGKVHFKNKYVRTPKYIEETKQQKVLYRGFGTQIPGGFFKNFLKMPANPANTNTIFHGGHLLALNEGGKPWAMKPDSLDTIGEFTYENQLRASQVFSAHGKVHVRTGDYINYGAGVSGFGLKGPKPCLNMYRISPQGKLFNNQQIPLDSFPFCHDFALTDKHAIFFIGSIVFGNMTPVIMGTRTISDQVKFDPSITMKVIVVDLDTLSEVKRFETDPGAIIHFGNAFEEGNEIIVDAMFTDNFVANDTLGDVFNPDGRFSGGTYMRYFLNMSTGEMRAEKVSDVESEFPTFNTSKSGSRHQVSYTACSVDNGANSFFNAIQSVSFDGDSKLVTLPPGYYGSEPLFVPSVGATREDDGYLLEVVYNGFDHLSELQIYRADDVSNQVCRIKLRHHVPHQFHGYFTEHTFMAA